MLPFPQHLAEVADMKELKPPGHLCNAKLKA